MNYKLKVVDLTWSEVSPHSERGNSVRAGISNDRKCNEGIH